MCVSLIYILHSSLFIAYSIHICTLSRWGISVIGAIDGFSRLVTLLVAENNIRARTVASHFLEAVEEYYWPSRLRTDRGGENRIVGSLMEEHHGAGRGSWLQGR